MEMPATNKTGEFRVIDIYRREGNKLPGNHALYGRYHQSLLPSFSKRERLTPDQRLCFNFNEIVSNQFGHNNQRVGRFNLVKDSPMRV